MKVLMTADTVGGVWTYALELSSALEPFGVEIVLATMGASLDAQQRQDALSLRNVLLEPSAFRLEWMQDAWTDVDRAGEWLLDLEARHAPDVIHLNGYAHGALPWNAPAMIVGHSCVRSWWTAVRRVAPSEVPAEWDEYTRRVRAGLHAVDVVVTPTVAMLGYLEEHYGALDHGEVILNGRSARRFAPGAKEDVILTAGRLWDEAKNVSMLARVAPALPWPVHVAGSVESPDGGVVQLPTNVRALGFLGAPEMASWLARASIFALPARYEPFGLAALEAGLAGCALVLGDIPTLREVWGDAAVYATPDDDETLVAEIARLASDRTRRRALARAARARALELNPQRMAVRYSAMYNRLRDAHASREAVACVS